MEIVYFILSSVADIMLPFGFTFGIFVIALWSIPLIIKFIKSIL